ncbi:hypothetical protein NEILACOT_05377 [Neisseria lactamica ATCC 23970]|uniref:Uncharacterized protein n=1 Tax=Neisseria lactamica ATCC 23970 TaxID=546265 RepID=D0WCU3_NEILA|nr:hypothetical protein NEILACOT_05377 [Neisseria lactamica ATCC 23970]
MEPILTDPKKLDSLIKRLSGSEFCTEQVVGFFVCGGCCFFTGFLPLGLGFGL